MPTRYGFAVPNYLRCAISDTLVGYASGVLVTALLLLLINDIWPGLEDVGSDIGIRIRIAAERWIHRDETMPFEAEVLRDGDARASSYIFLDVDPDADSSDAKTEPSQLACDALSRNPPAVWTPPAAPLRCPVSRPISRLLLASILRELRARGARLIVLNVELTHEQDSVPDSERKALDDVLDEPVSVSSAAIVFAAPMTRYGSADSPPGAVERQVRLVGAASGARRAFPGIALAPGMPVRRYARCYAIENSDRPWPTLPYLAARIAADPALINISPETLCQPGSQDEAPRIIYTLPSLPGDQDTQSTAYLNDWAFYRPVYNRCLASRFWDRQDSACGYAPPGQESLFRAKVVVVGASNPLRRDVLFTPIGPMSGAEVVVNAIRSFEQFPKQHEPTYWDQLGKELLIGLACSMVWLIFHVFNERQRERFDRQASNQAQWRQFRLWLVYWPALLLTVIAVVCLTVWLTLTDFGRLQSFNVLLGVLAVSFEQYGEVARWFHGGIEPIVDNLLQARRTHT